jgi:hypothetical protein
VNVRVQVFNYYMHLSHLVYVSGATGMTSPETLRFIITWKEGDKECRDEVRGSELSAAPTLPQLHDNYMMALHVIAEQARKIEDLELQIEAMKSVR